MGSETEGVRAGWPGERDEMGTSAGRWREASMSFGQAWSFKGRKRSLSSTTERELSDGGQGTRCPPRQS